MPALELDTEPSVLETPQSPDGLQFEDTIRHGQPATVVRDQQGNIVFPGFVPPEIRSPTSPISAASPASVGSARTPQPAAPLAEQEEPKKSQTDPPAPEKNKIISQEKGHHEDGIRPMSQVKRWATDAAPARSQRRTSTFPQQLKRAGTSYLDKAIWQGYPGDDTTSSSSSEDEAGHEAESEGMAAEERKRRKRELEDKRYGRFRVGNENYRTKGKVKRDGRLRITVNETANTGYLAKALGAAVKKVVPLREGDEEAQGIQRPMGPRLSSAISTTDRPLPRLNIVIMVIGSRGDAQPFLKIGKVLKEQYGHRVRIATHPAFREFVERDSGLEFFSVGGDPSELMAFMVKNPGMIPSLETVRAGDIGRRRTAMAEMFDGFWRACVNATDDEKDVQNLKMMGEKDPFVADAIIANPPSFAHIHCAEALGIPLHLMFTFPYTPTQAFPHPLASIKKSNVDPGYTNFISYPLVEMMVWQGLGDLVNEFRVKTLGLDPVSTLWAPGATYRLHVPFTYLWSPGLVPKPEDWGDEIDVSGFVFLDLASTFQPPRELEAFLDHGESPVYIGFGSIVVDDADHFTRMVFQAVELAGVRALVSKGWGGLGAENVPDNIFMLENTPHDWLFPKVQACVIHGGAGTTAIALKCGKPTMIVPFFGDQHFWGSMVGNAGAGPMPVPYKHLTAEKLAEGIKFCLTEAARAEAAKLAKDIELEGDGAENAVQSFHHHLTLRGRQSMRCSILPDRVATWKLKHSNVKLSPVAAEVIVEKGLIPWRKLRLIRHVEWNDFEGPGEPVTGAVGSVLGTVGNAFGGVGSLPVRIARLAQKRRDRKQRKKLARAKARGVYNRPGPKNPAQNDAAPTRLAGLGSNIGGQLDGTDGGRETKNDNSAENVCKEAASKVGGSESSKAKPSKVETGQGRGDVETASINTNTTAGDDTYVNEVTSGVGQTASAIVRAPVDLSLAVAQGFHNAPRLYGDETVRRPIRVTGIRSGLRAAGSEFVYGIYDGWGGLVRLPAREAKRGGVKGFVKGTGMGLTGFVLKNMAAVAGPVGYTLKGVAKQVDRGRQPIKFIRRARIFQGQRELRSLSGQTTNRGAGRNHRRHGIGNRQRSNTGHGLDRRRHDDSDSSSSDDGSNIDRRAEVEEQVIHGWQVMRELWEALEEVEKRKGLHKRLSARKKRGVGAVFESVEIAEQALAAVRKGEPISTVVGTEKQLRKSEDHRKRRSVDQPRDGSAADKRTSADKAKDENARRGQKKTSSAAKTREEDIPEEDQDALAPVENGAARTDKRENDVAVVEEAENAVSKEKERKRGSGRLGKSKGAGRARATTT